MAVHLNSIFAYSLGFNLSESLKIGCYNFSVTFVTQDLIEEKGHSYRGNRQTLLQNRICILIISLKERLMSFSIPTTLKIILYKH